MEEQNCGLLHELQQKEFDLVTLENDEVSLQKKEVLQKLKTTNIAIRKMERRKEELLAKNNMMIDATRPQGVVEEDREKKALDKQVKLRLQDINK